MTGLLSGKRAYVTGGSSGIGAAIVKTFAEEGARVAIGASSHTREAEALAKSLPANGGHLVVQADLTDRRQIAKAAEDVVSGLAGLDIFVHSAGVDVTHVRLIASALSGLACGLGGAHLTFDQHRFDAGMSGGRGFLALAAAILGRQRPGPTLLACVAFAALEAGQIALQDVLHLAPELLRMSPFVLTLALLAALGRRRTGR